MGGGKAADEAVALTFLTAPERVTAGSCLVSCWFCLFRFYAAALTPSPCLPRFQPDAAAAGVIGRGRAVRQGSATAAAWAQPRPQDALAAWDALAPLAPTAMAVAVPRRLHGGIPSHGCAAGAKLRQRDAPAPLAPAAAASPLTRGPRGAAAPVMVRPAPAIPRPHWGAAPPPGRATGAAWRTRPSSRLLAPPVAAVKALGAQATSVAAGCVCDGSTDAGCPTTALRCRSGARAPRRPRHGCGQPAALPGHWQVH